MKMGWAHFILSVILMTFISSAYAKMSANPKSKELPDDTPLKELLGSQYFKLTTLSQVEIKDLKGFVKYINESETLRCAFHKDKIPPKVKIELAAGSVWENTSGPTLYKNAYEVVDNNKPQELKIKLTKGGDNIELKCEFSNHLTGQFDNSGDEERQRSKCESRGGVFTRYSRKEYDFACDYKLKYADLKKLFAAVGFAFESRVEPPHISIVVLGQEKPSSTITKKKTRRQPSSLKSK